MGCTSFSAATLSIAAEVEDAGDFSIEEFLGGLDGGVFEGFGLGGTGAGPFRGFRLDVWSAGEEGETDARDTIVAERAFDDGFHFRAEDGRHQLLGKRGLDAEFTIFERPCGGFELFGCGVVGAGSEEGFDGGGLQGGGFGGGLRGGCRKSCFRVG